MTPLWSERHGIMCNDLMDKTIHPVNTPQALSERPKTVRVSVLNALWQSQQAQCEINTWHQHWDKTEATSALRADKQSTFSAANRMSVKNQHSLTEKNWRRCQCLNTQVQTSRVHLTLKVYSRSCSPTYKAAYDCNNIWIWSKIPNTHTHTMHKNNTHSRAWPWDLG